MAIKKGTVSVALATFNEEENIKGCLSSVISFASEIVLVDGGSTDKTVEIAKSFDSKIILTGNPVIFHINKQKALEACSGEWILQLDADEQVSAGLAKEISRITKMSQSERNTYAINPHKKLLFLRHQHLLELRDGFTGRDKADVVAFFLPRRNFFLGHKMTYAGTYPDGVIRLVKNGKAKFPCISVHEQILIDGNVGWLENDLLHYSNPTWKRYWLGAARYTTLVAMEMKKKKRNPLTRAWVFMIWKPVTTFFSLFFRYKGILDGVYGFLFSLFSASHYQIAYLKFLGLIHT